MASGSQCVNSRWDQTRRNQSRPVPTPGTTATSSSGPSPTQPPAIGLYPPQAGVEMAAAMAAKINAVLMAKGRLKPLQPLPSKVPLTAPVCTDDDVVAEVDINDVPINCRTLLTTGKIQEEIRQFSGAFVTTKGLYMGDAEKCGATSSARHLYLHVQGRSQTHVNNAVARIKEIISEDILRSSDGQQPPVMPTVPVYRKPLAAAATRPPNIPTIPGHKPPPPHSGSFVHTKIFVGLEQSHPSFNVNEHVEGRSGSYLQHIQSETGARVFLRGKGSGYMEQASRRESFEPLHLYVSHPNATGLEAAKKLCENLLETVRAEHARVTSTYAPSACTSTVYSTNNSYSSQSWYSYPMYPVSAGFWNNSGQSQLSNSPVQYPVWSREQTAFTQQDVNALCHGAEDCVSSPSDSPKPPEELQKTQDDVSAGDLVKVVTDRSSERILMPPPTVPLTSGRKRQREETLNNTGFAHTADEEQMKTMKLSEECSRSSGLVPYGGDSSDEEEERNRSAV